MQVDKHSSLLWKGCASAVPPYQTRCRNAYFGPKSGLTPTLVRRITDFGTEEERTHTDFGSEEERSSSGGVKEEECSFGFKKIDECIVQRWMIELLNHGCGLVNSRLFASFGIPSRCLRDAFETMMCVLKSFSQHIGMTLVSNMQVCGSVKCCFVNSHI